MQIYEELKARGLIAQVTDEAEIRDLINNGGAKFYIGFDCTWHLANAGFCSSLSCLLNWALEFLELMICMSGGVCTGLGA